MKIYNTMTRQKEEFITLHPMAVSMYVCGLTVYDEPHIGHGRTAVAFDVIMRYLRFRGYNVVFVRNITDIDDKIIKRAAEYGEPVESLVTRFIASMHRDFAALGTLPPDQEPRATTSIDTMIQLIIQLIQQDAAYVTAHGDVYYRVSSFKSYGKLSNQHTEQLRSGVRILPDEHKQDPLDFALWKTAKAGEPSWSSPWGYGRPGWHIECSAMSRYTLGDTIDIHGGGADLIFPHHENEIAQSEACTGKKLAHYWLHSGMVRVNQEKMSKSLNNFFTIQDVLNQYSAEVLRYFLLSGHYRSELDYSVENLAQAKTSLTRLYTALRDVPEGVYVTDNPYTARFIAAMDDDFNTPEALAVLFDVARAINRSKNDRDMAQASANGAILKFLANILNILQQSPEQFLAPSTQDNAFIEQLIAERHQARTNKDWAKSDQLRAQLAAMGIHVEDGNAGTQWKKR